MIAGLGSGDGTPTNVRLVPSNHAQRRWLKEGERRERERATQVFDRIIDRVFDAGYKAGARSHD